jgi:4-hydroxybenzoate polyprenyltransferase
MPAKAGIQWVIALSLWLWIPAFAGMTSYMMKQLSAFARLARLDKPTGYWLLLFPAWWSQALNTPLGHGPNAWLMFLFFVGSVVMRAAGCTINDVYDRKLDAKVARTKSRPVASGEISVPAAIVFAVVLTLIGLAVVWQMGMKALIYAAASLPLILIYPLMKRLTWWPQAFLGITFNWGVLVGAAATAGVIHLPTFFLYLACFCWTLAYDTIYAFQDVADDPKAGIKSTARLLKKPRAFVGLWYGLFWVLLLVAGLTAKLGFFFYLGMALALFEIDRLMRYWKSDDAKSCLETFRANTLLGWCVLFALIAGLLSPPM